MTTTFNDPTVILDHSALISKRHLLSYRVERMLRKRRGLEPRLAALEPGTWIPPLLLSTHPPRPGCGAHKEGAKKPLEDLLQPLSRLRS